MGSWFMDFAPAVRIPPKLATFQLSARKLRQSLALSRIMCFTELFLEQKMAEVYTSLGGRHLLSLGSDPARRTRTSYKALMNSFRWALRPDPCIHNPAH